MFGKQFYPTPQGIAETMLAGIDFDFIESILEPSAGKGDLANVAAKKIAAGRRYSYGERDRGKEAIDCVEIDQNLRHVLKGNGYRVVHDDFMTFHTMKKYDLIVMNPPFVDGAKHLLKAIEMQKRTGGQIVCILNAETIKNPCNHDREKLLQCLNEAQAQIKYMENAFSHAERKTAVEIAIVALQYEKPEESSQILQEYLRKKTYHGSEEQSSTAITHSNFIKAIVQQYNAETEAGLALIGEYNAMKPFLMKSLDPDSYDRGILTLAMDKGGTTLSEVGENEFIRAVRKKYWSALFQSKEFVKLLTSELMYSYGSRVDELADFDFSEFNIYTLQLEMSKMLNQSIEDTILKLFEDFTYTYSYEKHDNKHYFDGWKTNCAYMVKKKVIIPLMAWDWGRYHPNYYKTGERLRDIEKAMTYLDGGNTNFEDIASIMETAAKEEQTRNIETKYFFMTFYKKGTCHIEFKDMELLKRFNIFGCQRKGWLPPVYGKKKYSEMHPDEKAVVDSFEGQGEYQKVVQNPGRYIYEGSKMLALGNGINN